MGSLEEATKGPMDGAHATSSMLRYEATEGMDDLRRCRLPGYMRGSTMGSTCLDADI